MAPVAAALVAPAADIPKTGDLPRLPPAPTNPLVLAAIEEITDGSPRILCPVSMGFTAGLAVVSSVSNVVFRSFIAALGKVVCLTAVRVTTISAIPASSSSPAATATTTTVLAIIIGIVKCTGRIEAATEIGRIFRGPLGQLIGVPVRATHSTGTHRVAGIRITTAAAKTATRRKARLLVDRVHFSRATPVILPPVPPPDRQSLIPLLVAPAFSSSVRERRQLSKPPLVRITRDPYSFRGLDDELFHSASPPTTPMPPVPLRSSHGRSP
uniref:Uncharacterized protein n=1 Tax=Anopheles coluzzii TaxID=1518534 RepID=A0A8W7PJW0_ANOCL